MPIWLDGRLVEDADARISVLDRGFLFGDGVYELVRFFNGVGLQMEEHVARLRRSLREVAIEGFDAGRLPSIARELLEACGLHDASVYVQVTRGAASTRTHVPPSGLAPTVVAMASALPDLGSWRRPDELAAVLVEDPRWRRCDIKATSLIGNVLAVMHAAGRGADEAILHREGIVAEGASTSVFAVVGQTLVTPPLTLDPPILPGVTRLLAFAAARRCGLGHEERALRVEELNRASEILLTSSRRIVASVTRLDERPVGDGAAGPVARALVDAARAAIAEACGVRLEGAPREPAVSAAGGRT